MSLCIVGNTRLNNAQHTYTHPSCVHKEIDCPNSGNGRCAFLGGAFRIVPQVVYTV